MDFPNLNLPNAALKTKLVQGTIQVFDVVRKKYFKLTAEEWVRQHFIYYLNNDKNYPFSLMQVEKLVKYNNLKTRADIVVYDTKGLPNLIVECKAPNMKITQDVFNQIARYNFKLKVKYLVVTNGMRHFCCKVDYDSRDVIFLKEVPSFH